MKRELSIYFTSDIHGFFSDVDYPTGKVHAGGLCRCSSLFENNGNTLIIDGGDTIQGSPFTYWYHKQNQGSCYLPAEVMNAAGYQFITLGNHDFNYGVPVIEKYVEQLNAVCLCANIKGIRGVQKTAVVTLENGLRVGLTGVTSHYISRWEPPENLEGITVCDAFAAAKENLQELKDAGADVTVCIYHGGFENDIGTGKSLEPSDENQGWRICRELNYDIVLSGHQHQLIESASIAGTFTCQPPDKAGGFIRMDVEHCIGADGKKNISAHSCFVSAGETRDEKLWEILRKKEEQASEWLDTAAGTMDVSLEADNHVAMAANGSLIANFFNQVQLEASGAQISVTCLGNQVKGFLKNIRYRDVLANYLFPNTLKTILVDRRVLKQALERCAEYFKRLPDGKLTVSETFLKPIEQHFNYDYFSGIEVQMDIRKPVGERVISIRFEGKELDENRKLTLCLNNYRASGAGGYPVYGNCRLVREQSEEISEMIMDYVERHKTIIIDQTKWLRVIS